MWTKLALREGGNQLCPSFRFSKQEKKLTFQASTARNTFMSGWLDKWVLLLTCRWISAVCVTDLAFHFLCWWQEVYLEADHEGAATGVFCSHHYLEKKGDRSGLMVQCGKGVPIWTFHASLVRKLGLYSKVPATHWKDRVTWLLWMCYLWAKGTRNTCNDAVSVSRRNRGCPLPLLWGRSSWGREKSNLAEV